MQNGWTALFWAADQGHTSIIEQLLDRGAQVNLRDKVRSQ